MINCSQRYKISDGFIIFNVFLSLVLYFFIPDKYNLFSEIFALSIFLCSVFVYFFRDYKIRNFLNFDFIFTVSFFFCYFVYPIFIFPINKTRFFMFAYSFNENYIVRSTYLVLIGYHFFLMGLLFASKISISNRHYNLQATNLVPTILCLFFFIYHIYTYLKSGGRSVYSGNGSANPVGEVNIGGYLSILKESIFVVALSIEFYIIFHMPNKKKWYKRNFLLWFVIFFDIILTILVGQRRDALGYMLIIFFGYSVLNGGFNLKKILILIFFGFVGLSIVVVLRSGGAFKFSFNIVDMAMDLIINNYTLFLGYGYVQENGYIPFALIGSLLSAIPFLQGLTVGAFNINLYHTSSARFFSLLALGENPSFGVGTNIIASIYIGAGIFGVIALMFMLGFLVAFGSKNIKNASLLRLVFYFSLISYSIYLVRADFFFPVGKMFFEVMFSLIFTCVYIFKYKR